MAKHKTRARLEPAIESRNPVDLAAEAVGSYKELAQLMEMSPQGIQKMKQTRVIAERVLHMERVSGVSRHVIRPDLYPIEECPNCGFLIGASEQRVIRASHLNAGRNNNGSREAR